MYSAIAKQMDKNHCNYISMLSKSYLVCIAPRPSSFGRLTTPELHDRIKRSLQFIFYIKAVTRQNKSLEMTFS